jgi:hypothetical protein
MYLQDKAQGLLTIAQSRPVSRQGVLILLQLFLRVCRLHDHLYHIHPWQPTLELYQILQIHHPT